VFNEARESKNSTSITGIAYLKATCILRRTNVENIHGERAIVRTPTILYHHKHASSALLTWNLRIIRDLRCEGWPKTWFQCCSLRVNRISPDFINLDLRIADKLSISNESLDKKKEKKYQTCRLDRYKRSIACFDLRSYLHLFRILEWGLFKNRVENIVTIRYSLYVVSSANYSLRIARTCRRMLSTGNIMIPRKVNWIVTSRVVELMNRVAAVEFAFLPLWTDGRTRMASQARSYEFQSSVMKWIVHDGLDTNAAVMLVNYPRLRNTQEIPMDTMTNFGIVCRRCTAAVTAKAK